MNLLDLFVKLGVDDEATEKIGQIGSSLKSGLTNAGKVAAAGIGLVTTAAGTAVAGLLSLEESTEEYRVAQGKLNTAFEAAGYSAETASQAYNAFYGILGDTDTATEASQLLAKLADSEEDVATWTNIAAGVSGTFGDSLPIEGLIEASNETAKVGEVTGSLADALNWAGISEDDFNAALAECTDESERNQLIMDTLSGTYDEASDAFYRNNEALVESRNNQAQLDETLAALGETVAEVKNNLLSEFLPAISDVAESFGDMISGVDGADVAFSDAVSSLVQSAADKLPEFLSFGAQIMSSVLSGIIQSVPDIVAQIPGILGDIGEAIGDALGLGIDAESIETAISNLATTFYNLIPAITGVTAAVVAYKTAMAISALIQGVSQAITAFKTANEAATIAQAALNAVMNANPFVLIGTLIAGVVTALVTLWTTNEGFRDAVIGIWESIVSAFTSAGQAIQEAWASVVSFFSSLWTSISSAAVSAAGMISNAFTAAWAGIQAAWSGVVSFFSSVWEGIKAVFAVVATFLIGYFSNAWQGIQSVWSAATGFFENVWNTIKGIFSVVAAVLSGNFSDAWAAIQGIFSGWGSYFQGLWDQVVSVFSNALGTFADIGRNIVQGIWNGISGMASWLFGKITGFFGGIVDGVKSFLGIASPSKVFASIGGYMAEGLGVGWDDEFSTVRKGIEAGLSFGSGTAFISAAYSGTGSTASQSLGALGSIVFEEGAIVVNTRATDAKAIAKDLYPAVKNMLQSEVTRKRVAHGAA